MRELVSYILSAVALSCLVLAALFLVNYSFSPSGPVITSVPASHRADRIPAVIPATSTPGAVKTASTTTTPAVKKSPQKAVQIKLKPQVAASTTEAAPPPLYTTAPVPFDVTNPVIRAALVNILCTQSLSGYESYISGSGIVVDPRGVVLTNAHVAQFVLLSEDPSLHVSCSIRTGSPATPRSVAHVLYISRGWVAEHAKDITNSDPLGTGEDDYALLIEDTPAPNMQLPVRFPSVPFDAREGVTLTGDPVLVASYPAGFLGSIEASRDLNAVSTVTNIKTIYTFNSANHVDVISLGGVIAAQGGSSGGAVVNDHGYLTGLVVTSSAGTTTADRDLRAITLAHIDRAFTAETGVELTEFLDGDLQSRLAEFNSMYLQQLLAVYHAVLPVR